MSELGDMKAERNQLEGIKEVYKRVIIDSIEKMEESKKNGKVLEYCRSLGWLNKYDQAQRFYFASQYVDRIGMDNSMGSNERWAIVGGKNLFGLNCICEKDGYYLQGISGRFQMQKFPSEFFTKKIDISDILDRNDEDKYNEIVEFYNMNNREVFEKYGFNVDSSSKAQKKLVVDSLLLDSLLKDKYSEIKSIYCGMSMKSSYCIHIIMDDGTEIITGDPDNIINNKKEDALLIKKDGKYALVDYETINKSGKYTINDLNDLAVENVEYIGDEELVNKLKDAMAEQSLENEITINSLDDLAVESVGYIRDEEPVNKLNDVMAEQSLDNEISINDLDDEKMERSSEEIKEESLTKEQPELFKYQVELDIFEEEYFSGENIKGFIQDNRLFGKGAFSPVIVRKTENDKVKFFLQLGSDKYNKYLTDQKSIDITNMSKADIMNSVKEILVLTNEELLEKFNINTLPNNIKFDLKLDDEIKRYSEENDNEIDSALYSERYNLYVLRNGETIDIDESPDMKKTVVYRKNLIEGDIEGFIYSPRTSGISFINRNDNNKLLNRLLLAIHDNLYKIGDLNSDELHKSVKSFLSETARSSMIEQAQSELINMERSADKDSKNIEVGGD